MPISFSSFPQIETERLLLRKSNHSDSDIISYLRTDPEVNKFVKRAPARNKEEALQFIDRVNTQFDNSLCVYWSITLKPSENMIGSICLWNFSTDQKTAEIGYDLDPKFQGKGIMTEALEQVIQFGFSNLGFDHLEAYTSYENNKSLSLLKNNGFNLIPGKVDKGNPKNLIFGLDKHNLAPKR